MNASHSVHRNLSVEREERGHRSLLLPLANHRNKICSILQTNLIQEKKILLELSGDNEASAIGFLADSERVSSLVDYV
jgi:hypothetical protein